MQHRALTQTLASVLFQSTLTNVAWSLVASLGFGLAAGSIPFGHLAGMAKGLDIRRLGSGNIGSTNVLRTMGTRWAIPVLVLDILKGVGPVLLAARAGLAPSLVAVGAVLGHVFTPWLAFRGGKGVATAIGVAAVISPRSAAAALACFVVVLLVTGLVSASSLAFALTLPPFTAVLYRGTAELLVFSLVLAAIIVTRHCANIGRLIARTEPRLSLWLKLFHNNE